MSSSSTSNDAIELRGLPLLTSHEFPSFSLNSCPKVREFETLRAIKKFKMFAIRLLIPSAFLIDRSWADNSYDALFGEAVFVGDEKIKNWKEFDQGKARNDNSMVLPIASSITFFCRLFFESLWMQFYTGEFGLWGVNGGNSLVDRSDYQCKVGSRCLEYRDKSCEYQ
ncbi:hypothetical protein ACH5RR_002636 [Cinchona calisaya]|uniref:Uncharacterized protein n=1 Tax=Cinchona calisaya TaxID=153742 RepID=A0ABD3ASJ8_9GENT